MNLTEHITAHRVLADCICQRLSAEIIKLGFTTAELPHWPQYDHAIFELVKDPITGSHHLSGAWTDAQQQRIGRLQFNSDGSFYAEYDVVKPHPVKIRWFVEGVTAWGNAENIKAEAKLLPMPAG